MKTILSMFTAIQNMSKANIAMAELVNAGLMDASLLNKHATKITIDTQLLTDEQSAIEALDDAFVQGIFQNDDSIASWSRHDVYLFLYMVALNGPMLVEFGQLRFDLLDTVKMHVDICATPRLLGDHPAALALQALASESVGCETRTGLKKAADRFFAAIG